MAIQGLIIVTLFLLIGPKPAFAQENKINFGIEQDFLPWITGGHYASAWVGKDHLRVRALTAHVKKPALITPKGFDHNTVTAYAFVGEYFLREDWTGWSFSSGLVYWNSSIQRDGYATIKKYSNTLLHGSLSWTLRLSNHFYLTPWAGMHLRIAGAKSVSADGASFRTPVFNPEASLKIGFLF